VASTRGTKALPLPTSLVDGLSTLGFIEIPREGEPSSWRLPRHPGFEVVATTSNLPGSTAVIARVHGTMRGRLEVDDLLTILAGHVMTADSPNRSA
jgi:hypothetical protein